MIDSIFPVGGGGGGLVNGEKQAGVTTKNANGKKYHLLYFNVDCASMFL